MISIIAAIGKNRELGYKNDLIWKLKGDMAYFKKTTLNHTVIMGRNTYESIGRPLPNRENIVISSKPIDNVKTVSDPSLCLSYKEDEEVFIIGGASIYKYFIPYADKLYLTEINDEKEADVYFPEFNHDDFVKEEVEKRVENEIEYTFVVYTRK